jgi:hypothetical protein
LIVGGGGIIALIGTFGLKGKVEEAARRGGTDDGARLSRGKGGDVVWKEELTGGVGLSAAVRKRKGKAGRRAAAGEEAGPGRVRGKMVRSFSLFFF